MDRGIDGFRMDVITAGFEDLIRTASCREKRLEIEDYPVGEAKGYTNQSPFMVPMVRASTSSFAEMRREVFEGREGYMNVGEAPGITPERNELSPIRRTSELDMLFLFDHGHRPGRNQNGEHLLF